MWDSNNNKRITIIRHGETIANEQRLYCGFSDIELSEKGIASLYKIKDENIYTDFDLYITSGMKRTNQTIKILFDKPYIENSDFKEINFGDFELKSYEQLKNNESYLTWIENVEENKIPNGESKKDFKKRVLNSFENIYNNEFKNIVIVCHNGVIATIMQELFPLEKDKNFYSWGIKNGEGYSIIFKDKKITYEKIGGKL